LLAGRGKQSSLRLCPRPKDKKGRRPSDKKKDHPVLLIKSWSERRNGRSAGRETEKEKGGLKKN